MGNCCNDAMLRRQHADVGTTHSGMPLRTREMLQTIRMIRGPWVAPAAFCAFRCNSGSNKGNTCSLEATSTCNPYYLARARLPVEAQARPSNFSAKIGRPSAQIGRGLPVPSTVPDGGWSCARHRHIPAALNNPVTLNNDNEYLADVPGSAQLSHECGRFQDGEI